MCVFEWLSKGVCAWVGETLTCEEEHERPDDPRRPVIPIEVPGQPATIQNLSRHSVQESANACEMSGCLELQVVQEVDGLLL